MPRVRRNVIVIRRIMGKDRAALRRNTAVAGTAVCRACVSAQERIVLCSYHQDVTCELRRERSVRERASVINLVPRYDQRIAAHFSRSIYPNHSTMFN